TEPVGQDQPALDAAFLLAEPVMVHDAMDPIAAKLAVVTTAHQRRVLPRHRRLIAVAVESPGLYLALVQLAAMQQLMKRMLVVVTLGADGAQLLLQFFGAQNLGHGFTSSYPILMKRRSSSP